MTTTISRAASETPKVPAPRQAASLLTSFALVAAGLGVAAGLQLATAASGTVTGTVFEDYDQDGTHDAREPGVPDVVVTAVDADGNRTRDVRTDAEGTYEIDLGVVEGDDLGPGPYRIEFFGWPGHLEEGPVGPDSGSSIQFVAADSIDVSLGLAAPSDYCQQNPDIVGTCFVYAGLDSPSSWPTVVGVGWDWEDNNSTRNPNGQIDWMRDGAGQPVAETVLATVGDTGAVWGEAWDRAAGVVYVGSFVKRHTSLGPTGNPTTIYRIDTNGTLSDTSDDTIEPWITVDPSAPDPHSGSSDGWHADFEAFDAVYQSGLGDVEISRDGSTIYTVDLRNKTLVSIPIDADGSAGPPTTISIVDRMGLVDGYTPTEGSCAHADLQPAGLGVDADDRVHVGVVCTAASTITRDGSNYDVDGSASRIDGWTGSNVSMVPGDPFALHGYVVEWDGQATGSFTPVVDFRLDGARGCVAFGRSCPFGGDAEWRPWVDHYPYVNDEDTYSQPVVTDIDFDNDAMLVALADRWGHQTGPETRVRKVDGSTQRFRHPVAGGDLKRACGNGDGSYTMEGSGGCPVNRSDYGEDEFFVDDRYRGTHLETGQGSVALAPGFDRFIHAQMDPVNASSTWRSGGFAWTDPDTGEKERGLRIYDGRNFTPTGTFEKASGIGDVELACEAAPLTIGNRVWLDLDGDGRQGADEPGVDGVVVTLLSADDTVITSTTTAIDATGAAGTWSFAIEPDTAYSVQFDASSVTGLPLGITADELHFTTPTVGDTRLDSDADDTGTIDVAPRRAGENDHSLDVGLVPIPDMPALDIEKLVTAENGTGALIDADSSGDGAGIAWYTPGVTATYEIRVTNTGEIDLTDVVVSDPLLPDCAATIDRLAIDGVSTWQCTFEIPAQTSFVNVATASITWTPAYGPGRDTPQVVSDTDDAVVRIVDPAIEIVKSVPNADPYEFGDDVTYTYRVRNTGDVDLALGSPARLTDDTCSTITPVGSPVNDGDLDGDGILDVEADIAGIDDGAQEVWVFSCTTTVDAADFDPGDPQTEITNIVGVTGTPVTPDGGPTGLADVADRDEETITVHDPSITIETQVKDPVTGVWRNADSLDGETGDDAASVAHHVDTAAEYRYVVTNTGNLHLGSLTLTDNGAHVTGCGLPRTPEGLLAPGATLTIAGDDSCWSGTLTGAGSVLLNTGGIEATPVDPDGAPIAGLDTVRDTDPATIHLIEAAIDVEKTPVLQTLARGGEAAWSFEVTNTSTGIDELENVSLVDLSSIGLVCEPTVTGGDTDDDGRLDLGETWTYACAVGDVTESGEDTATVTGDVPDGIPTPPFEGDAYQVTDRDDAEHRIGELTISKWVRVADLHAHTDAAAEAGPWSSDVTVRVDDQVEFLVVASNRGATPLIDVAVSDDQCSLTLVGIDGDTSGSDDEATQLAIMSVGETWSYTCAMSSDTVTTIVNTATATGDVVADPSVPEADMISGDTAQSVQAIAEYSTVEPSLSVHLYWPGTAGPIDADDDAGTVGSNDATPPVHLDGDTVTGVVVVTNTGGATLHDVALVHDLGDDCSPLAGTLDELAPGATHVLSCSFTAGATGAAHLASASAARSTIDGLEIGAVVTDADDRDAATYVIAAIDLIKQVVTGADVADADTVLDAVALLQGTDVTWRLTATNTGQVDLVDVVISDPIDLAADGAVDCGPFTAATLAVGEQIVFDCTTGPIAGDIANTARVDAGAPDPANGVDAARSVADTDPAHVIMLERASIGDLIWHDLDGDGVQDADEPGLSSIDVDLLDGDGTVVASTTTDVDGRYGFTQLPPGPYQIRVSLPAGWVVSPANQGADDAVDSDLSATGLMVPTTLDPGEADLTFDGGLYQPASIGDLVWYDADADGLQSDDEVGIADVAVSLLDGDGEVVAVTTTDADGGYRFDGLAPGTYRVSFTPPDAMMSSPRDHGENDDVDSDADPDGETTDVVLVSGSAVRDRDAGFFEPAAIGNLVWIDADGDGFQDEDEAGVADVTVRLLDENGDVVATTVTDHAGRYRFEGLAPGMYRIEVVAPSGTEVTDPDLDPGDLADSDIDATTARTPLTELVAGEVDQSWDAGLVIPTVVLSTPNEVGETPELAFTGATVVGLAAAGLLLIGLGGTARILSDRMRRRPGLV